MTRKAGPGRDRLLENAGALFAASGYEGVSTKQLAAGAGLSIGALYHHFPTKLAAYRAALEWGLSRIPPPAQAVFDEAGDPRAQQEALVAWFCSVISAQTIESQLLRLELLDPHLETTLSALSPLSLAFDRFQHLMTKAAPEADPQLTVAAIVSLSFGFIRLAGLRLEVPEFAQRMQDPAEIAATVTRLVLSAPSIAPVD